MSLRGFLDELVRRGVLKAAAAYGAAVWLLLEVLTLAFQSFDAPGSVLKVITALFPAGFPVACLMSWGFDATSESVRLVGFRTRKPEDPPAGAASSRPESQAPAGPPTIEPGFSLDRRRRVLPHRTPEIFERPREGLRKAGLPA